MNHYNHRQKLHTTDLFTTSKNITIFYDMTFYSSLNRKQKRDVWSNIDLNGLVNILRPEDFNYEFLNALRLK